MAEPSLKCNFPKCTLFVTGRATVTSCSHIFCKIHKIQGDVAITCPACKTMLDGEKEVFWRNLNPPEEVKAMFLNGYSPNTIFQIMTKGLQFWAYQLHLLNVRQENGIGYLRARLAERESTIENIQLNIKHYIQKQEKNVDLLKNEVEKLTKSLNETESQLNEKNRQLYNLQSRYDQLRRQSVASIITKNVEPMDMEPPNFRDLKSLTNREYAPPTPSQHVLYHNRSFQSKLRGANYPQQGFFRVASD